MTVLRLALVSLMALLLQLTVFVDVRFLGIAPELPALIAVLVGIQAGSHKGSLFAFFVGLAWDLYLSTPLGLAAVSFAVVAYGLGAIEKDLLGDTRVQTATLTLGGSAAAVTTYALLGEVFGQNSLVDGELLRIVLVSSLINAVLSVPMAQVMRWVLMSSQVRSRPHLYSVSHP